MAQATKYAEAQQPIRDGKAPGLKLMKELLARARAGISLVG